MTEEVTTLYATTRLVTGGAYNTAYVKNRMTGKTILGCKHQHRSNRTAQKCADKLLRMYEAGWRYMDVNWNKP